MANTDENKTEQVKEQPIINLVPYVPIKTVDTIGKKVGTGCSTEKEYEDIIYIPLQKKFWVITKQVDYELEHATTTLYNNAKGITGKSAEEKAKAMEQLDISHLVKFFFNPSPVSFLSKEEQNQYNELKQKNEKAELEIWLGNGNRLEDGTVPKQSSLDITGVLGVPVRRQYNDYNHIYQTTQAQLKELERKGINAAEKQGYIADNGEIYSPEQIKLQEIIKKYASNKKEILANEDAKNMLTTVFDKLDNLKKNIQNIGYLRYFNPEYAFQLELELEQLSELVKNHITTILELAALGISTPEFSLGQAAASKEGEQIVKRGMQRVLYMEAEKNKREPILDELEQLFADWQFFLANIGDSVPASAFIEKLQSLIQLDERIEHFIEDAEKATAQFVPPKILLWDPTSYKPKTNTALLNAPIAIREFSKSKPLVYKDPKSSRKVKDLHQISIIDIAKITQNTPQFLKKMADYTSSFPTVKKRLKNLNNNQDEVFEIYLKEKGCIPIEVEGKNWYTSEKLFNPEDLYNYLKSQKIKVNALENKDDREGWGKLLQYTIFKDEFFNRVMGFDPSYGAQLVRLLSKHTKQYVPFMEYASSTTINTPSLPNFSLGSISGKLVASPYHGKLNLISCYLPNLANALHPTVSFLHHKTREPIELDFGYFVFKLDLEAAGFTGACLALSGSLALNASHSRFNVQLEQPATLAEKSKGGVASLDGEVFAGIQSGFNGTVQCKWCPPKGTKGHFWRRLDLTLKQIQGDQTIDGKLNDELSPLEEANYKTLSSVALGLHGSVGIGANASFGLTANREKIRLHLGAGITYGIGAKAGISLEVDYAAAIDLVRIVLQAIRKNDNRPIGWYDDMEQAIDALPSGRDKNGDILISESFYRFSTALMLVGRQTASLLFGMATLSISKVETLYKEMTADYGIMAGHLANPAHEPELKDWFAELHPQAIGALLYHLTKDLAGNNSWSSYIKLHDSDKFTTGQLIANQQMALANFVTWLLNRNKPGERSNQLYPNTAQAIFGEALLRMNAEGTNANLDRYYQAVDTDKAKVWAEQADKENYYKNIELIRETMAREVTASNTGLTSSRDATKLQELVDKSRAAKKQFERRFPELFRSSIIDTSYTLTDYIQQRDQRMIALNALGGNRNEQTA